MGIIVQLVTEGLNEVSSDIRKYQASLTKELKLLVDSLQEKERSKLQAVNFFFINLSMQVTYNV